MDTIINLGTIFASFVIYQLIFHFVSSWFSAKVSPCFNALSLEKKIKWNLRVVSTCQGLVVGVFSLCIILFREAATADPLWNDPWLVKVNIAITTGYIISDGRSSGIHWEFRLIVQLSTLFYNQRWFLKTLGYSKSSEAYIISGVFMTVMFLIVRIAAIPPFYYCIYSMYGTDAYFGLGLLIQCSWIGSFVVLDVMNVIRMIRILREWVHLSQDTLSHQTRVSNQKSSS
ncbi:TLC domain-containing protein 4-like isoform X1 [Elephas maximus indicus]|uniref:TLC domain-containing protein 4-like isoform X1 n=1 Tax=Elephas maximus indicus TaxID=99487 RepID=UPI002116D0A8|nr:TLC domain-containing protein 4-like isoform X1 [Elephas maximus indicus]